MAKLRMNSFTQYRSEEQTPGQVQIQQIVSLRIKSGSATSGPPIGPVLGQYAIPISKFCTEFNDRTTDIFKDGVAVFVTLFYFVDYSYAFELSIPISSICLLRAARRRKGSGTARGRHTRENKKLRLPSPCRRNGLLTPYMVYEAALYRMLFSGGKGYYSMRAVCRKAFGTLRSMGIFLYVRRSL